LPVDDRHLYSETYLQSLLTVRLGCRAGEMVGIGEASGGGADDLAKADDLATRMVRELGLSPHLGPIGYPAGGGFLGQSFAGRPRKRCRANRSTSFWAATAPPPGEDPRLLLTGRR
ncbi:MAG: hypothetical protein GY701_35580, partial [Sulfitobacter sp.]|nr:hypothetical protein [Sulfitobacter sp.]